MATSITNTSVTTDDLTVDTSTLKVDAANNRVGIGTATPTQATLHVDGGGVPARFESTSAGTSYVQFGASGTTNYGQIAMNGDDMTLRTAYQDRMTITSGGVITKPSQPFFEACFSTSGWTDYTKGGTWVKMEMDATITNVGGHYDTTNTRFVAPVAGKYFMSASVFLNVTWNSATPYLSYLGFYKNNSFFSHFGQDVQSTEHIRHGIIMPLAANDYVDVRIQQAQTPTTNQYYKQANARNYTYFHGMLIG